MAKQITRLTAAVHEAGHLAAMLSDPAGPHVESVQVGGPGDLLGHVNCTSLWQPYMASFDPENPKNAHIVDAARRDVIQYLAGPIAELRWKRHSRWSIILAADEFAARCLDQIDHPPGSDFARVRARVNWAYPDEERSSFCNLWIESEDLVARHWNNITLMGRVLNSVLKMSSEEICEAWSEITKSQSADN